MPASLVLGVAELALAPNRFGILPKGRILRSPCRSFYLQLIEPEPGIVDFEGDVAVGIAKLVVGSIPVVGQLQNATLRKSPGGALAHVVRCAVAVGGAVQKVERELHLGKIKLAQHPHTHDAGVEGQRYRRVLDAQHGMVEDKPTGRVGHCGVDAGMALGGKAHGKKFFRVEMMARGCPIRRVGEQRMGCDGKCNYLPTAATAFGTASFTCARLGMLVTFAAGSACICWRSTLITQRRR